MARQIVAAGVPYAMIVGGEPTLVPHFMDVCRALSNGGVLLKIETNGQRFDPAALAGLGVRSVQISLDGATQAPYAKQRINGSLEKALAACRSTVAAGLPLEITFAPTRINICDIEPVIELAASLGAFRFNTGQLMRLGNAAKLWDRLELSASQYEVFLSVLRRKDRELAGQIELCYKPFSLHEDMTARFRDPSGTLLILPDGRVKVAASLPWICADLRSQTLLSAWSAYQKAWHDPRVRLSLEQLAADPAFSANANEWKSLESADDLPAMV